MTVVTVIGTNPGGRKTMCFFLAESTLNREKFHLDKVVATIVFDGQTVKVSQTVPRHPKNLKSGNAGIFAHVDEQRRPNGGLSWSKRDIRDDKGMPDPVVHAVADLEVLQSLCISSPCMVRHCITQISASVW